MNPFTQYIPDAQMRQRQAEVYHRLWYKGMTTIQEIGQVEQDLEDVATWHVLFCLFTMPLTAQLLQRVNEVLQMCGYKDTAYTWNYIAQAEEDFHRHVFDMTGIRVRSTISFHREQLHAKRAAAKPWETGWPSVEVPWPAVVLAR